ncbi:hypothetical protein F5887DRAFT_1084361 [Amanita rubescens]|nr:hypothetical protein F5887DRAFT_1084361 [Amanita rubescens]
MSVSGSPWDDIPQVININTGATIPPPPGATLLENPYTHPRVSNGTPNSQFTPYPDRFSPPPWAGSSIPPPTASYPPQTPADLSGPQSPASFGTTPISGYTDRDFPNLAERHIDVQPSRSSAQQQNGSPNNDEQMAALLEYLDPLAAHPIMNITADIKLLIRIFATLLYFSMFLFLPVFYRTRVNKIFCGVRLTKDEIASRRASGLPPPSRRPKSWEELNDSWSALADSVVNEWGMLTIVSVLLLSAIYNVVQLGVHGSHLVQCTALMSLVGALMSLIFGCLYVIQFSTMQRPYVVKEWAQYTIHSFRSSWWNIFTLLSLPFVWLSWSIILFIICLMSTIWQASGETTDGRGLNSVALEVKIIVSAFLFMGGIHLCLVLIGFSQYDDNDENWTERFKRLIRPASTVRLHKPSSVAAASAALPPQHQESHRHGIEIHPPSQPSNAPSIPFANIDPATPAPSSQPRNSNNLRRRSVPAMTTAEETTVPSSQQQNLPGRNTTRAHQHSQPQSGEHPVANPAAPPSNSSSLSPQAPDNSYPGNRFVRFAASTELISPQSAPLSTSSAASSPRGPARSNVVNYPTTPAGGRSRSHSINSPLPPFTSRESASALSPISPFTSPPSSLGASAPYTSVPQHTNTPFISSQQSYASGALPTSPTPPIGGLARYGSSSYKPRPYISSYMQTSHRTQASSLYVPPVAPGYGSSPYASTPFVPPYAPTSYRSPYASAPHRSPYASTPYRSTPQASTPYEFKLYSTPYYRSVRSVPSTLAPPVTSPAIPSSSVLIPPGPSAALLSPPLATTQEERPSTTHQKDEPYGSPTQIQRSARVRKNEQRISAKVTDLPPGFVPNISQGILNFTSGAPDAGRGVGHSSDLESWYSPSEEGSIRATTPVIVVADNGLNMESGDRVQASTSSSTTAIPSSSNPVNLSPSPRHHPRGPG